MVTEILSRKCHKMSLHLAKLQPFQVSHGSLYLINFICNKSRKRLFQAAFKNQAEEKQKVSASLAAAEEVSVDAAVKHVSKESDWCTLDVVYSYIVGFVDNEKIDVIDVQENLSLLLHRGANRPSGNLFSQESVGGLGKKGEDLTLGGSGTKEGGGLGSLFSTSLLPDLLIRARGSG